MQERPTSAIPAKTQRPAPAGATARAERPGPPHGAD